MHFNRRTLMLKKVRMNPILISFALSVLLVSIVSIALFSSSGLITSSIKSAFATAENENGEEDGIEQQEGETSGGSDNLVDENNDPSNSDLTPQQGEDNNTCPIIETEGPTYTDENGCTIPCPETQGGSVPQGGPQPKQQLQLPQEGTEGVPDETINLGPDLGEFERMVNQEVCDDGIDNNKNGLIDKRPCIPPSTQNFEVQEQDLLRLQEFCKDGVDNNRNGLRDESPCVQLTRENATMSYFLGRELNCQDNIDNDWDFATDKQDKDCAVPGLLTTPGDKIPKDVTGSEEASPQGLLEPSTTTSEEGLTNYVSSKSLPH